MMKISLKSIIYMKLWTDSLGFFLEVASGWLESCFSAYHREIPPVAVTSKGWKAWDHLQEWAPTSQLYMGWGEITPVNHV